MNAPYYVISTMPNSIERRGPYPHTIGELLDPVTHLTIKDDTPTLAFPTSENRSTWEALADAELQKAGFKRRTPWTDFGMEARTLVQRTTTREHQTA